MSLDVSHDRLLPPPTPFSFPPRDPRWRTGEEGEDQREARKSLSGKSTRKKKNQLVNVNLLQSLTTPLISVLANLVKIFGKRRFFSLLFKLFFGQFFLEFFKNLT